MTQYRFKMQKWTKYLQDNMDEKRAFNIFHTHGVSLEFLLEKYPNLNLQSILKLKDQHSIASQSKNNNTKYSNIKLPQLKETICTYYHKLNTLSTIQYLLQNNNPIKTIDGDQEFIMLMEESCFYPQGGGQPGDCGIFYNKNNSIKGNIIDTKCQLNHKNQKIIYHICKLSEGTVNLQDQIYLSVNIATRNANTRAHSATHLLGDYLIKNYNINIQHTGNGEDCLYIDIEGKENNLPSIIEEKEKIEQEINHVIQKATGVKIYNIDIKDIEKYNIPASYAKYDSIRIVEYPGISLQPCGGTHVKNTKDIGNLQIIDIKPMGQNTIKIRANTNIKIVN